MFHKLKDKFRMSRFSLSDDQTKALRQFKTWLASGSREFRLGGLAGTGKTTIVSQICEMIGQCDVFAPTARAAQVLRAKGIEANTLHSLLMKFTHEEIDDRGRVVPQFIDKNAHRQIMAVDESSMVSRGMYQKIMRCADRVVWIGDYGQLPPVEQDASGFCLMNEETLNAKLTTQHRHAGNGELIDFANHLRAGKSPSEFVAIATVTINPPVANGKDVVQYAAECGASIVICYTNQWRAGFNIEMRRLLDMPETGFCQGLKITCSKNHYREKICNGEMFEVKSNTGSEISTTCGRMFQATFDKTKTKCVLVEDGFAVTCHKAQGSEFAKVVVVEDAIACPHWRYTAATRAQKSLTYFQNR